MEIPTNVFKEEANELLTELESVLLELSQSPDKLELIDRIFGAFHTIKGAGSMFGFESVTKFTHEIESTLECVRQRLLPVTPELINLCLSARDTIACMLDENLNTLNVEAYEILSSFIQLREGLAFPVKEKPSISEIIEKKKIFVTYRIRFKPPENIFTTGTNLLLLLGELEEMGEYSVIAKRDMIPSLDKITPDNCYISWDIVLTTDHSEQDIHDVFMFVQKRSALDITAVIEHVDPAGEDYTKLGEILLDRGDLSADELKGILQQQKKIGETLINSEIVTPEKVEAALSEQKHMRKVLKREKEKSLSSLRVDSKRIDNLVDLVGELVTVQARLTQKAAGKSDPELKLIAESVERLTEELRDNAMSIRMVPIGTLFSRVRRHIHDLSDELGKPTRLTTEGSGTEIDKTIIDQLSEPLVHIIRNAMHHGIEEQAVRDTLGKSSLGNIHLTALHEGAYVVVKIEDDGAGIDAEKVKTAALEKGLIEADAEMSEKECFDLICRPGFSTMTEADNVSGRGVGMDVVKRAINNLRGTITIESTVNEGTTISLRLPLTLAIIDGLLVKVEHEYYVFPLSVVDECVEMEMGEAQLSRERSMMTYRGEVFTYISLRDILGIQGETPEIEKIILVKVGEKRTGFSVDQVIGQHQTVIKTLSTVYGNVEGISGATILGDGTVAMILDVSQLIHVKKNGAQNSQHVNVEYA